MLDSDKDLTNLKTVSSFDPGVSSTMTCGPPALKSFTPASLLIQSLIQQLCRWIEKDPKKRKEIYLSICSSLHDMHLIDLSYKIDEYQFMRSHYRQAVTKLMTITHQTTADEFVLHPQSSFSFFPGVFEVSRYVTEFEELTFIARGGFGNVFKVRHKLDGGIYAVKKICLRYRSKGFLRNLNEVKMLAQLYHPNIVAYKAAWLENIHRDQLVPFKSVKCIMNQSSSSSSPKKLQNGSSNSLEIVFQDSKSEVSEVKQDTLYSKQSLLTGEFSQSSIALIKSLEKVTSPSDFSAPVEHCNQLALRGINCDERFTTSVSMESEWAMLYIQMQLCHATLRNWLDQRNESMIPVDSDACLRIFKQITSGLDYIHSQKIVHHDIKPSNIFVSKDIREVQVGDFGLACHILAHTDPDTLVEFLPHTPGRVGTELYAAPEQLQGFCNPKSDIYSLGIVLLELIHPFQTLMERSKVIGQVKNGQIPVEILSTYPHLAKVITKTVNRDYKQRPSSSELLSNLSSTETEATQVKLKQQEEMIASLQRESAEKDKLIAFLQSQLRLAMVRDDASS